MKLDDQILILEENGANKVILLSGDITEDEDLLIAHDLNGNEYLIYWDLARYNTPKPHGLFEYWHGDTLLKELRYQTALLEKHHIRAGMEVDVKVLKNIERELNKKGPELTK